MGEGLVVESAVEATSSIGSNGAEEAFFDGDADGATDRHLYMYLPRWKRDMLFL